MDRSTLTPEERDRRLQVEVHRYLRGEITVEEYEEFERLYRPDYGAAISAIAERTVKSGQVVRPVVFHMKRPRSRFARRVDKEMKRTGQIVPSR